MYLRQVEIELNQPAIEPARKNGVHQPLQLFKKENVKRQRIPIPRELHRKVPRHHRPPRQQRDAHANGEMHQHVARRMHYVAVKQKYNRFHPRQIRVRYPLERPRSRNSLR